MIKFLFGLSIAALLSCVCLMFLSSGMDICYCILAILILLHSLGLVLIMKQRRIGAMLLLSALAFMIIGAIYYSFSTIATGLIAYACLVCWLLFLQKEKGKPLYSLLLPGIDYKHNRHILQLYGITFILLGGYAIYKSFSGSVVDEQQISNDDVVMTFDYEQRIRSIDITFEEIMDLEAHHKELFGEGTMQSRMLFALKHLFIGALLSDKRDVENLRNICTLHLREFSNEQQEIISWYLSLPREQQEQWVYCEKAHSLVEFQNMLKLNLTE